MFAGKINLYWVQHLTAEMCCKFSSLKQCCMTESPFEMGDVGVIERVSSSADCCLRSASAHRV